MTEEKDNRKILEEMAGSLTLEVDKLKSSYNKVYSQLQTFHIRSLAFFSFLCTAISSIY